METLPHNHSEANSASFFETIIGLLPNPILVDVIENDIPTPLYCNRRFIELIGYTSREIKAYKDAHLHYFNQVK